jgi:acyl-CoA synthetase (AMP-forming)/AMP-acid ligase II
MITDRLQNIAKFTPQKPLVFDVRNGWQSYAEVTEKTEFLIGALRSLDIDPGDIVIIQLPNCSEFLIFHLAVSAIGAITATIPVVYRERELRGVVEQTGAKAIVIPRSYRGHDYLKMAEDLKAAASSLTHIFVVDEAGRSVSGDGVVDYDTLIAQKKTISWANLRPELDDLTALGFTSGTTGNLKAAMYSTRVLTATNDGLRNRYDLNTEDRVFACSPVGHAVGFTHALRMTLSIGGSIVMLDHWDCARALELSQTTQCTYMACATPFLNDIVYHSDLQRRGALSSVRLFLCGGATIPRQLMKDARERMPYTFTSPLWGMTECGGVTTCPFDAPEEKLFETDGLPCDGMELKVVDRNGHTLAIGDEGELMARGPMVTLGYFRQDELTKEYFLPDGFFRTGDLARIDADGYVRVTGRIKDLIIRGGVNIAPAEIEELLFRHPHVSSVAVVGAPDSRLGERICAYVVLSKGRDLSLREVQDWMRAAQIAQNKWPEFIEVVDRLPMTTSGKIQKFILRDMIANKIGS